MFDMLFYPKEITPYYNALRKLKLPINSSLNSSSFRISEVFDEVVSEDVIDPDLIYKLGENSHQRRLIHEIYMYKRALLRLKDLHEHIADYPRRIEEKTLTQEIIDKTAFITNDRLERLEKEIQKAFSNISTNNHHVTKYTELKPTYLKYLIGPNGIETVWYNFKNNNFGFIEVPSYKLFFSTREEIIYKNINNEFNLIDSELAEHVYECEEQDIYTYLSVISEEEYYKEMRINKVKDKF